MKFIYNVVLIFFFIEKILSQFQEDCEELKSQTELNEIDPDKTLEKIRDYMWDLADNISMKPNLLRKKLKLGILPDEYPINMKIRAKKVRADRERWEDVMLYPTSVWRSCVYPNFKINYKSWCRQKMPIQDPTNKLESKFKI